MPSVTSKPFVLRRDRAKRRHVSKHPNSQPFETRLRIRSAAPQGERESFSPGWRTVNQLFVSIQIQNRMNMQSNIIALIDLSSCQHWSQDMPYRAVVAIKTQPNNGPVLYQVAGAADTPRKADKALKLALEKHGGKCFYCKTSNATDVSIEMTLDHIEPQALGGNSELSNLVIACKPCNALKGHTLIDAFNPAATEEWLLALAKQIDSRFERLKTTPQPSQPQPSLPAAAGP
jgi:5-methylcytosine-specific restriction endonuclease McrA